MYFSASKEVHMRNNATNYAIFYGKYGESDKKNVRVGRRYDINKLN